MSKVNQASLVAQWLRIQLLMQEMRETQVQSLGQGDGLGEEMAAPLQNSCLGDPMDRGA